MKTVFRTLALATLVQLALTGSARAQDVKLTLAHPYPKSTVYTRNCLELAAEIGRRAEGSLRIEILPYDARVGSNLSQAVRDGQVDLACVSASTYSQHVPENVAITTANVGPVAARAGGGMALMDEYHRQYFNSKYLGWTSGGVRMRLYLRDAPRFNDKGLPDLIGLELPDNPVHGPFMRILGAQTKQMIPKIRSLLLESDRFPGTPWPTIGLRKRKWDHFLRHAIDQEFFVLDIGWIMNLDRWNSLSAEAQMLIQDTVIAFEARNETMLSKMAAEEKQALIDGGMQFHKVPNRVHFRRMAVNSLYEELEHVSETNNRDTSQHAKLRKAFQNP